PWRHPAPGHHTAAPAYTPTPSADTHADRARDATQPAGAHPATGNTRCQPAAQPVGATTWTGIAGLRTGPGSFRAGGGIRARRLAGGCAMASGISVVPSGASQVVQGTGR